MLPDNLFKQFTEGLRQTAIAAKAFQDLQSQYAIQTQKIGESISRALNEVPRQIIDFTQILNNLDKAGLTPNLGKNASVHKLKDYQKLLKCGYPIFWVPRSEIVDQLLTARKESERKAVIRRNKKEIVEDCRKAISVIDSKNLKDAKEHLGAAIDAIEKGNSRSAQSTASVCIDAQLDQIIDTADLDNFSQVPKQARTDSKKLKAIMNVPVNVLYAALQAELLVFIFRDFDRLKPNTVRTKYSRHSSIHSVSARQYSELNSIQAIMIATSLLATSDKLGKGWLSGIAKLV